jgi:hypothetical protein
MSCVIQTSFLHVVLTKVSKVIAEIQWRSQRRAIAQYRKILISMHVRRLIKYLKVEENIREIVPKKAIELAC